MKVWGNEPSHSQGNSHFGRWSPSGFPNLQRAIAWGVPYIIGKPLEHRCPKWARMTHLDIWNTSYGQKKGQESNWQFDSRPLKVGNQPNFLACRWRATYPWKAGLQLSLRPHFNLRSACKVIWPQSHGSLDFGRLSRQNAIWMWASWRGTKYTIKGKVVASPKSGPWWVLWIRIGPSLILAPKVLQICINQLVV
jgi:hypothetical protein